MGTFVPTTAAEREQMLRTIGVSSVEDLFRDVPQQMYLDGYLDLPPGRSELETLEAVSALAERNRVFKTCLRGAGSYRHYIPAAVKAVVTRYRGKVKWYEICDGLYALSGRDQPGHFTGNFRVPDHAL